LTDVVRETTTERQESSLKADLTVERQAFK